MKTEPLPMAIHMLINTLDQIFTLLISLVPTHPL